jgi:hypothetical protein
MTIWTDSISFGPRRQLAVFRPSPASPRHRSILRRTAGVTTGALSSPRLTALPFLLPVQVSPPTSPSSSPSPSPSSSPLRLRHRHRLRLRHPILTRYKIPDPCNPVPPHVSSRHHQSVDHTKPDQTKLRPNKHVPHQAQMRHWLIQANHHRRYRHPHPMSYPTQAISRFSPTQPNYPHQPDRPDPPRPDPTRLRPTIYHAATPGFHVICRYRIRSPCVGRTEGKTS